MSGDASRVSDDLGAGDPTAAERLFPLVYDELRAVAGSFMRRERAGHTLQPTVLVHEAYLRLVGSDVEWEGRQQFLAVAARAMRRVLVDHARRRGADKRGGEWCRVTLDESRDDSGAEAFDVNVLDLHRALERLEELSERKAQVVELKFFGGLTMPEIAEHFGLALSTVEEHWTFARAWLYRELKCG